MADSNIQAQPQGVRVEVQLQYEFAVPVASPTHTVL